MMQLSACAQRPRLTISTSSTPSKQYGVVRSISGHVSPCSRRTCSLLVRSAACGESSSRHLVHRCKRIASPPPCSATGDAGSVNIISLSEPTSPKLSKSDHSVGHTDGDSSATLERTNGNGNSTFSSHSSTELQRNGNGNGHGDLRSSIITNAAPVEFPVAFSGQAGTAITSNVSAAPTLNTTAPYTLSRALHALYLFSRPHTMLGTTLSVISISMLALGAAPPSPLLSKTAGIALAQALSSALLMNVSIVGINQLTDIAIDRVNKPTLPLASGEMTPAAGVAICLACTAGALAIGQSAASPPLMITLVGSLLLGFFYSVELPFMRWKRSPLLAAGCILVVRAFLVQLGFYTHMAQAVGVFAWPSVVGGSGVLGGLFGGAGTVAATAGAAVTAIAAGGGVVGGGAGVAAAGGVAATAAAVTAAVAPGLLATLQPLITRPLAFTVVFMLLFSVVIALFKDIPDVEGDTQEGISTFSVRLGPRKVFWTCIWILTAAYAGAIGFAFATLPVASCLPQLAFSVGGHLAMTAILWSNAFKVEFTSKAQITAFYMLVWKLFYAEYLIIPALQFGKLARAVPLPTWAFGWPRTVVVELLKRCANGLMGGSLTPLSPLESARFTLQKSDDTLKNMQLAAFKRGLME